MRRGRYKRMGTIALGKTKGATCMTQRLDIVKGGFGALGKSERLGSRLYVMEDSSDVADGRKKTKAAARDLDTCPSSLFSSTLAIAPSGRTDKASESPFTLSRNGVGNIAHLLLFRQLGFSADPPAKLVEWRSNRSKLDRSFHPAHMCGTYLSSIRYSQTGGQVA